MDRVQIYIDSSKLYKGAKSNCGNGKVELSKFCKFLADGRPLVKVKYYCVKPPEPTRSHFDVSTSLGLRKYQGAIISYKKQLSWLKQLTQWKKIEMIYGRLQRIRPGELKEKGVDVALALDLVIDSASKNYETAIVVSGDADLVLAIKTAIDWGKKVEGCAFQPCYHISQVCRPFKFTELTCELIQPFIRN